MNGCADTTGALYFLASIVEVPVDFGASAVFVRSYCVSGETRVIKLFVVGPVAADRLVSKRKELSIKRSYLANFDMTIREVRYVIVFEVAMGGYNVRHF